jgi:hypothetical protein
MAKNKNSKVETEKISNFEVVKKVLQENGRISLKNAIEKAKAIKTLKVKNEDYVWRYTFLNAAKYEKVKIEKEVFVELV